MARAGGAPAAALAGRPAADRIATRRTRLPLPASVRAGRRAGFSSSSSSRSSSTSDDDLGPSRADLARWAADYPPVDGSLGPPGGQRDGAFGSVDGRAIGGRGGIGTGGVRAGSGSPFCDPMAGAVEGKGGPRSDGGVGGAGRFDGQGLASRTRVDGRPDAHAPHRVGNRRHDGALDRFRGASSLAGRSSPACPAPPQGVVSASVGSLLPRGSSASPSSPRPPQGFPPPLEAFAPRAPATPVSDISEAMLRGSESLRSSRRRRGESERAASSRQGRGGVAIDGVDGGAFGDDADGDRRVPAPAPESESESESRSDLPRRRTSWWRLALPFPLPSGIGVPSARHAEDGSAAEHAAEDASSSPSSSSPLRRLLFDRRWRKRQAERLRSHPIWFPSGRGGTDASDAAALGRNRGGGGASLFSDARGSSSSSGSSGPFQAYGDGRRSLPATVGSKGALFPEDARPFSPSSPSSSSLGNGTFFLLVINLALAVLRSASFPSSAFLDRLALLHWDPRPWQLATASFCHASWSHLASNAFGLLVFGKAVEEEVGGLGVVLCYLVCGAGGLAASLLASPGAPVASLGASASVFGLFAVATLLKLRWSPRSLLEAAILGSFAFEQIDHELRELAGSQRAAGTLRRVAGRLSGGRSAPTALVSASASSVRIAHGAHVAGAALGALVAVACIRSRRAEKRGGGSRGGGFRKWLWRIIW